MEHNMSMKKNRAINNKKTEPEKSGSSPAEANIVVTKAQVKANRIVFKKPSLRNFFANENGHSGIEYMMVSNKAMITQGKRNDIFTKVTVIPKAAVIKIAE
jgi:hypothetical protein